MVVGRSTFFLTLFCIIVVVFTMGKVIWLMHSKKTTGVYAFRGGGNALDQMRKSFSEIYFFVGNDTVWFEGPGNLQLKKGDQVPVLYQPQQPANAKVNTFMSLWGGPVIYSSILFLVLLAIYLHPEIVPRRSKLQLLVRKPFIRIV